MRLAASQSPKDDGKLTELAAEVQRAAAKEKETKAEMIILQVLVNWRVIINEREKLFIYLICAGNVFIKKFFPGTNERCSGFERKECRKSQE